MKRLLALVLVFTLFCTVALANETKLKVLNPDLYPVKEGAELTVWCGQDGNVQDYPDNPETAALEKLTGVHINWITAPGKQSDMNVAFNLNIAAGDYPDMYLNLFDTSTIMSYAKDVFIPLNDYIENTHWMKQYLEDAPELREALTAPDGNIYSFWKYLPAEGDEWSERNYYKLWIYLPWLEASGMDMPETLEELREYLRYIRDHDMNGNGDPNDEIPIYGSYVIDNEGTDPTYAIMQQFQLTPGNWLWADENHNVTCVATTDNFREGLKYLNSMYDEGLISEDIYARTDYRDVVNVTKPEDTVVAICAAPYWVRLCTVSVYGERAYDDFTYIPPLKKDADTPAQTYSVKPVPALQGAVTVACKDPQLAVDWIDACIDPEINRVTILGNEDEYWTRVSEEGELPIVTKTIDGMELRDGGTQNMHTYGSWVFPGVPNKYYDTYYEEGTPTYKMHEKQVAANKAYSEVGVENSFPAVVWCDDLDLIAEMNELSTAIDNAISTAYAEFILGRRDIEDDAVWEEYKNSLEDLGLSRYIEVAHDYNFGK